MSPTGRQTTATALVGAALDVVQPDRPVEIAARTEAAEAWAIRYAVLGWPVHPHCRGDRA